MRRRESRRSRHHLCFLLFLYAATGVVTAFHLYYLLVLSAFGVPQNSWEFIALLLSLCILICAYLSLYKPVLAARIVLIATLGMWFFYGPAIVATARAGHLTQLTKIQGAALPYSAVVLLLLTTAYSFFASGRKSGAGVVGTWLFPARTRRLTRIAAIVLPAFALVVCVAWFSRGSQTSQPATSRFLIPEGYVGWVHVEFDVPGAEPVSSQQGQYVFNIPADGKLSTSSPERFGWNNDEYFYVSLQACIRCRLAPGTAGWYGERSMASGEMLRRGGSMRNSLLATSSSSERARDGRAGASASAPSSN